MVCLKFNPFLGFKSQKIQDFLNPYKVLGGIRGLVLSPFFKGCMFPTVIEAKVKFTNPKKVELGKWVRIRYGTQVLDNVELGDGVFIGRHCDIGSNTTVEENVTLADYVSILGNTHELNNPEKRAGKTYSPGETVIGKGAWIGYRAIILPQVKYIGKGAVIGAGAVVTKDIPDHSVAVGNPAKIIYKL